MFPYVFFFFRADAQRSAEEDAEPGVSRDPSVGQLSGVLHTRHALSDGGNAWCFWLLRAGRDELLGSGLRRRSWEVSRKSTITRFTRESLALNVKEEFRMRCEVDTDRLLSEA